MEEKTIERKVNFYTKNYGENALREMILEVEKHTYNKKGEYL